MADPQLNVQIGAQIGGLVSGLKQAEEAIKNLTAPIDQVTTSFGRIGEAIGLTFAVDKIREFISELGELGEHAYVAGTAFGMSALQFQEFADAMKLMGGNIDQMERGFYRLGQAVESALGDPASKHAIALNSVLKDSGVNAQQFGNILLKDPLAAIKLLADQFQRLGAMGGASGPWGALFGPRGFEEWVRALQGGSGELQKFIDRGKELTGTTQEQLETLRKIKEAENELALAWEGVGRAMVENFAGPLIAALNTITAILTALRSISSWEGLGPKMDRFLDQMGKAQPGFWEEFWRGFRGGGPGASTAPPFMQKESYGGSGNLLDMIEHYESGGRNIMVQGHPESHASGNFQIEPDTWRRWGMNVPGALRFSRAMDAPYQLQRAVAGYGLATEGPGPWARYNPQLAAAIGGMGDGAEEFQKDLQAKRDYERAKKEADAEYELKDAQLKQEIQRQKEHSDQVNQLEQQREALAIEHQKKIAEAGAAYEKRVPGALDPGTTQRNQAAVTRIQTDEIRRQMAEREKQAEQDFRSANEKIQNELKIQDQQLKRVDQEQRLGQLSVTQAEEQSQQILADHQKMIDGILAQEEKSAGDIARIADQIRLERERIDDQYLRERQTREDKANQEIQKSAKQMDDMLASDLSNALIGIATGRQTFLSTFTQLGEKIGGNILTGLLKTGFGMTGIGNMLGAGGSMSWLGDLLGGSAIAGLGGGGGAGLSAIFGSAAPIAEGAFMFLQRGGIVPSAAGGWMVPSFQGGGVLARLHSNEMVLPSHISQAVQNMAAGGGGATVNIHAIDSQSGAQFLMRNAGSVGQAALRYSSVSPRAVSSGGARFP